MTDERLRILRMLQEGKISVEEALRLLNALGGTGKEREEAGSGGATGPRGRTSWLRVKVTNSRTGRVTANVNLPLSLVNVGLGIVRRFADVPELEKIDLHEILGAVREGVSGKIIEAEDEESGERVEVTIE